MVGISGELRPPSRLRRFHLRAIRYGGQVDGTAADIRREDGEPTRNRTDYLTLAWAFFLSAQYFFILWDTAFLAPADIVRVRF